MSDRGRSSTATMRFGTLYAASRKPTFTRNSAASRLAPGASTTAAATDSPPVEFGYPTTAVSATATATDG